MMRVIRFAVGFDSEFNKICLWSLIFHPRSQVLVPHGLTCMSLMACSGFLLCSLPLNWFSDFLSSVPVLWSLPLLLPCFGGANYKLAAWKREVEQCIVSVQENREPWEEQDLTFTGTAWERAPLGIYFHLKKCLFPRLWNSGSDVHIKTSNCNLFYSRWKCSGYILWKVMKCRKLIDLLDFG